MKTATPLWLTIGVLVLTSGCGLSEEEVRRLADERIATAAAAVPTVTPALTPTPQPTATPITLPSIPTPHPTATPVTFPLTPTPQPTATPAPTATPQPTPTPIRLPPTPTPQPTPTPLPPFVLAQLVPTPTPFAVRITPTPTPPGPAGPAVASSQSIQLGDGLTLTLDPGQPSTGRTTRFYLSGLSPWQRLTVTVLNPIGVPAEWTSEDETFIVDQASQRIKTETLYGDGNGRAAWARLNALDTEGQWTVQASVDGKQYVGRFTLLPLQLQTSVSNDLGISMRRYSGSSSEVYLSSGVPLSLALDLSGFLPPLTEKVSPWLNLSSVQIPNVYLFSSSALLRQASTAGGATDIGPRVGFYRPTGKYRGVYVTVNAFNSETIKTVIHEYAHLLIEETAPTTDIPAWLNEGLATYLENHLAPDFGAGLSAQREIFDKADKVKSRLAANSLIPLACLVSQRNWNAQTDQELVSLQYAEAYMAVRYFTERFGNPSVGLILRELERSKSFEAAFLAVTRTSLSAFEQDWTGWLRQWQDPVREQIRQYVLQTQGILNDVDAISADRAVFLKSPAGSGPFSQRVPTETQLVNRANQAAARGTVLTPPSPLRAFQADLVVFLSTYQKWLQTELTASLNADNSLIAQANKLIPEVDGRDNLLTGRLFSVRFNYGLAGQ